VTWSQTDLNMMRCYSLIVSKVNAGFFLNAVFSNTVDGFFAHLFLHAMLYLWRKKVWYQGLCVVAPNTDQGCNRHCSTISLVCCLCITKPHLFFVLCSSHSQKIAICVSDFFRCMLYFTMQNEERISWNQKSDVRVVSMCMYKYHHLVCLIFVCNNSCA